VGDYTTEVNKLFSDDIILATLDTFITPFIISEVKTIIKYLNSKKAPGYDLITNQILWKLPEMGIKYHPTI